MAPPDADYAVALFQAALLGCDLDARGVPAGAKKAEGPKKTPEAAPPAEKAPAPAAEPEAKAPPKAEGGQARDIVRRKTVRPLYRGPGQTEVWAENNYYHVPIADQNAALVTPNPFWRDYAARDPKQPFLSAAFIYAHRSFTEMALALAVLDLPLESARHETVVRDAGLTITAGGPMIVFSRQMREVREPAAKGPLLVRQGFFRADDRYRWEGGQRFDKFVTGEMLVAAVYGAQVVVTNATSAPQRLELLLQVPRGAMPVAGSLATRSVAADLAPFSTRTWEYFFYFPQTGEFPQYPAHAARDGSLAGFAEPATFKVVETLSRPDPTSWEYVARSASAEDVLRFLATQNLHRLDLDRIAWRMSDKAFFERTLDLLAGRHIYNGTLWSYALKHDAPAACREFLQHQDEFVRQAGLWLDTPLLGIDSVVRRAYRHLEFGPVVNARAHARGGERRPLSAPVAAQYEALLKVLCYRPSLDDEDLMAVTYYLLLQDRVEEALGFFGRVKPEGLAERLQYDYFAAYLAFYTEDLAAARRLADRYANYPVDRWRRLFAAVAAQLDEIQGKPAAVVDDQDRAQAQAQFAGAETGFDMAIEGDTVALAYQNLAEFRVNYYRMDVELLFSKNPFAQQFAGPFTYVKPIESAVVPLKEKKGTFRFDLPKAYRSSNVVVEVESGGVRQSRTHYANSMVVQLAENYGLLKVAGADGRLLAKVYVKVYARESAGVRFYKDGYTDLRGQFDYASLTAADPPQVERFAILVLSESDGAVVREAAPPKR